MNNLAQNKMNFNLQGSQEFFAVNNTQSLTPYGKLMPEMQYAKSGEHGYGFNGMEREDLLKGLGIMYDFGARVYNADKGIFNSGDPMESKFPSQSTYVFAGDDPINKVDVEGAIGIDPGRREEYNQADYEAKKLYPGDSKSQTEFVRIKLKKVDEAIGDGVKLFVRYGTPGEDIYGAFSGQDFDGNDYNRFEAATWSAVSFLPLGRIFSMASKTTLKVINGSIKKLSAVDANLKHINKGRKAPYAANSEVLQFATAEKEKFVRVFYDDGKNVPNKMGRWFMKAEDIEGLSPAEIKDKFALPNLPNKMVNVTVPEGTLMRSGEAAGQKGWGAGGGTQFETIKYLDDSSYGTVSDIPTTGGN